MPHSGNELRRRAWICGDRLRTASNNGLRTAGSCMTSSTFCSTPTRPSMRRAEFFRKGGRMRGVVKGKRWLLLTRWVNLEGKKRQQLNDLFALNRRVMKAYLLKEAWSGCGPIAMKERCFV